MKEIIVSVIISLLLNFALHAQTGYEDEMNEAMSLWESGKTVEAANKFERIAKAEQDQWVPYYYAAQMKIIESFSMTNAVKKEQQLKDAQNLLNDAKTFRGKEDVELTVMQAMLNTALITLDPSVYGMKLSPVINEMYNKAAAQAPDNPRVALAKTEWNMGAARYYGQDPKKFCDDLKAVLPLFESYRAEEPFAPSWGEERAKMLIEANCKE